jgi:hypothetical protein
VVCYRAFKGKKKAELATWVYATVLDNTVSNTTCYIHTFTIHQLLINSCWI